VLIIHYTADLSMEKTVAWFQDPRANASAHIVIGRDGKLTQLVPFNHKAWHAGKSAWGNLEGLNSHSIGIELVNGGKLRRADRKWLTWYGVQVPDSEVVEATHPKEIVPAGWQIYPRPRLRPLCPPRLALHERYAFLDIMATMKVAPGRKTDPGPAFAMGQLPRQVLGGNDQESFIMCVPLTVSAATEVGAIDG